MLPRSTKLTPNSPPWRFVAAALALSILAACAIEQPSAQLGDCIAEPAHSPWVPAGYRLAWSDEFCDLSIDPDATGAGTWTDHIVGSGERYLASNDDDAWHGWDGNRGRTGRAPATLREAAGGSILGASGGSLHLWGRRLKPHQQPYFEGKPYAAAMITTERSFGWLYGYVEVRARINRISKGHHFALWMLLHPWDWRQEIDIVELRGIDPSEFRAVAHDWSASGERLGYSTSRYRAPNGARAWHSFGFLWTADELTWTVDGTVVKRQNNFIDRPMFFLASWEIDSWFSGTVDATTEWPAHAELDYVRVYQRGSDVPAVTHRPVPPQGAVLTVR